LTSPSSFQIRYVGTKVTAAGSIMVPRTRPNNALRPRNWKYEKPNATSALDAVTARAADKPTTMLLVSHDSMGSSRQTVT